MADNVEDAAGGQFESSIPPRERPWLLPYNRKLRHLQGITIRNLTLTPRPTRLRGKTADDEAIPSTFSSPAKALAQLEVNTIAHSRSSSDLRSVEESPKRSSANIPSQGSPKKPVRPSILKDRRRRSTMEWIGASPQERQKKLEDVIAARMADVFFSLHIEDYQDPIYISEVVEKTMNPNFRFFDIGSCGPGVTRLDKLTVKVWATTKYMQDWQYLVEFNVNLRALQFIGKSLGTFEHPLPSNCILFHMTDGIYTSFVDLPIGEKIPFIPVAPPRPQADGRVLPSSSYDALMRLSTLDDCIQDALATRDRLAEEIELILSKNKEAISTVHQVPESEERLRVVENAVSSERRRLEAAKRKRDELKVSIQFRKNEMRKWREYQARVEEDLIPEIENNIKETKVLIRRTKEDMTGQRRRICEDLLKIYPIDPIPNRPLSFTICGLSLPNSDFEDANQDTAAAALGYVAEVLSLLSPYLGIDLPYPVDVKGSSSTVEDPLSVSETKGFQRTYPLFMKGVVRYRFEYGVFLLNKDIEILCNELGLRIIDIRQTLPNLKYLLFVATAGEGELPVRKAGGVRGLLRRGGDGDLERPGSRDSAATASSLVDKIVGDGGANGSFRTHDHGKGKGSEKTTSALQSMQKAVVVERSKLRQVE
ncbi:UV radiation resistance-associated gene protein [Delitschia confertaspora ATCC 74209]|uniref:Autophagy-related protein 14 n=1 Tax=Delitschia confertaspora ATCC 74209 TaxID=1513339 RepID=A0A9P4JQB6_9PLEO|nr:UV radiation resistance-associated gene protein [Delitschia confertaspora ATCC 74209]